jgi:hypothetical protein
MLDLVPHSQPIVARSTEKSSNHYNLNLNHQENKNGNESSTIINYFSDCCRIIWH